MPEVLKQPEILQQLKSDGNQKDVNEFKILLARQLTNPEIALDDISNQLAAQELTLQDLELQITNPNIKLKDLGLQVSDPEIKAKGVSLKITNPDLDLATLDIRVKAPQITLQDQKLENGFYLILVKSFSARVKLALFLPNQSPEDGWVIRKQEALIGRMDELENIMPDVDLTPKLRNPVKISRQQAFLHEDDGIWKIYLHKEARSSVFVNGNRLEQGEDVELKDDYVLNFGADPNNPEVRLFVRLLPD